MKRLFWGLLLMASASLLIPMSATAAEFKTYVGCDDFAQSPVPSHVCLLGEFPGAFFESSADAEYEVCVEFPNQEFICAEEQEAEEGVLYVNSITTDQPGIHFVSWYVGDTEVGSWSFRMDAPVPPTPPAPVVPPPAQPAVAPTPSPNCLAAQLQVGKLKHRLQKAGGAKQKKKIRAKLRNARNAVNREC